jgi:hypothetical protein
MNAHNGNHTVVHVGVNLTTIAPPMPPVTNANNGCITSDPAQMDTKPAKPPLWTSQASFLLSNPPVIIPPANAINELTATKPLINDNERADITLKPNQPTINAHEPNDNHGTFDGGGIANTWPPRVGKRPIRGPNTIHAENATQPLSWASTPMKQILGIAFEANE